MIFGGMFESGFEFLPGCYWAGLERELTIQSLALGHVHVFLHLPVDSSDSPSGVVIPKAHLATNTRIFATVICSAILVLRRPP